MECGFPPSVFAVYIHPKTHREFQCLEGFTLRALRALIAVPDTRRKL